MDADDSGYRGTSTSIELTGTQAETLRHQVGGANNQQEMINQGEHERAIIDKSKMLLMLLEKFVCVVTSDAMINMQVQPEVCKGRPSVSVEESYHESL